MSVRRFDFCLVTFMAPQCTNKSHLKFDFVYFMCFRVNVHTLYNAHIYIQHVCVCVCPCAFSHKNEPIPELSYKHWDKKCFSTWSKLSNFYGILKRGLNFSTNLHMLIQKQTCIRKSEIQKENQNFSFLWVCKKFSTNILIQAVHPKTKRLKWFQ